MTAHEDPCQDIYPRLFGEVVTTDCYHLRTLDFTPDVILDIGANVGYFTRFARRLFPRARIVAVEPHPENFALLTTHTGDHNTVMLNKALGSGQIWHAPDPINGAHATYLCEGLGYYSGSLQEAPRYQPVETATVQLDALLNQYASPGLTVMVKLDCEGAENSLFGHAPSMQAIKAVNFIAAEIHFFAAHGGEPLRNVKRQIGAGMEALRLTHTCEFDGIMFYARRKAA